MENGLHPIFYFMTRSKLVHSQHFMMGIAYETIGGVKQPLESIPRLSGASRTRDAAGDRSVNSVTLPYGNMILKGSSDLFFQEGS